MYCFMFFQQIKEMEGMYKELGEESLNREICQALATNFRWISFLCIHICIIYVRAHTQRHMQLPPSNEIDSSF